MLELLTAFTQHILYKCDKFFTTFIIHNLTSSEKREILSATSVSIKISNIKLRAFGVNKLVVKKTNEIKNQHL